MKKIFIFVFYFLNLCSCSAKMDYPDLADKIVRDYSKGVKKKYDFSVFGTGGSMRDAVNSVFISYSSHQKVDINMARVLYIDISQELINKFNGNEQIRPFLANYPFTYNNLELDLSFFDNNNRSYEDGHITFVTITNGKIRYVIQDPTITDNNPLVTIYKEPYEEALRIVRESRTQSTAPSQQR